jgi:hypothetical protein
MTFIASGNSRIGNDCRITRARDTSPERLPVTPVNRVRKHGLPNLIALGACSGEIQGRRVMARGTKNWLSAHEIIALVFAIMQNQDVFSVLNCRIGVAAPG